MGEGVSFKIVKEVPLTINNRTVTIVRNFRRKRMGCL